MPYPIPSSVVSSFSPKKSSTVPHPNNQNATTTTHILPSTSPPPPQQMATKLGFTLTAPRLFSARFRKPVALFSSNSPSSSSSSSRVRLVSLVDRQLCVRRRLFILSPKATTDQPGQVQEDEVVDSKILPYCSIDKKEKKSLGELEQEFLQALQAFYYEGRAIMSNEEFDNLKEELMWEGSSIVMLTSDEQKFLEASMAYVAGTPIMSDEEYDKLKMKLKMDGSDIVVEGPRCSLRSRKVYSDLSVDYFKMFLLNVPAALIALTLFFFLDDLTGFEITYLLEELPEPFSFIFTWFAALPLILWALVQIVGQKMSPSLGPSYQYLIVVPPTLLNAQALEMDPCEGIYDMRSARMSKQVRVAKLCTSGITISVNEALNIVFH
ncbi:unnamed protein product [Camellia sinensis]